MRLGAFGKGRKTAKITEEDGDVAAMTLQDAFVSGRNDQLRERRCKKPFEPGHSLDFRQLRCDPLFECFVPGGKLRSLRLHLIMGAGQGIA